MSQKTSSKIDAQNAATKEVKCELCSGTILLGAAICPHCKAQRKPCPFCGRPFWHGVDICPHCKAAKPNPDTWSMI